MPAKNSSALTAFPIQYFYDPIFMKNLLHTGELWMQSSLSVPLSQVKEEMMGKAA